ncbi:MAG: hypothetical protein KA746_15130 [Pyrinomonadaceae bacterium]|nr:hypothetical protein [Pyrinomonadaceae bacterium]
MDNPIVIGVLSWLIPGSGHLVQRRLKRGLVIAAVVWTLFIVAVLSGGSHYPGFDFKDGALLYVLNSFARLGNGVGAVISWIIASRPAPNVAALATFEYGGRFLEVAGLLNFLAVLDAVDIAVGRKK